MSVQHDVMLWAGRNALSRLLPIMAKSQIRGWPWPQYLSHLEPQVMWLLHGVV